MNPSQKHAFEELKATGRLPSPKGVALAIFELTQQEDVTAAEVTHLVQTDPALAGRLLKLANAASMGGTRPVVSLSQAVMMLGIPMVRKTTLALSLLSENMSGKCPGFDYKRFWSASLATAIANQWLSFRAQTAVDETFTCGLLSKVGRLALATVYPEEYGAILQEAGGDEAALTRLEQARFAADHRDITAAMLADWGLPAVFVEAVYHHENPAEATMEEGSRKWLLTQTLHFAARVACFCTADEAGRREMLPALYTLGEQVNLDAAGVGTLIQQVSTEWQEWGHILEVPTAEVPPLETLGEPPGGSGACLRILVAEGSAETRTRLENALAGAGHVVMGAADGKEALSLLLDFQPQILVADSALKEMDGLALTRALRANREGRRIYILLLTPVGDREAVEAAFEAGADDCLPRPLDERMLLAHLRAGQRQVALADEIRQERDEERRSVAELSVTNRRLLEAAMTDALTQLPNRRYATERLTQEWAEASRHHKPLSCMLVDLDHFKRINDTYGHDAGDEALRQVAALLRKTTRHEDTVCRLGGEEFLVLCPGSDIRATLQAAERIRRVFEGSEFTILGAAHLRFTVSIGVAAREESMESLDAMLKSADQALYAAKQGGRNRVAVGRKA